MGERAHEWVQEALSYARLAFPTFPVYTIRDGRCTCGNPACGSPGKHPRIKSWSYAATTDEATIRDWGEQFAEANLGMPMGSSSGVVALDVDPRNGGDKALEYLTSEHGPLPDTVESQTGGGGQHFLFRCPDHTVRSTTLLPGLELKGEGSFIVVPPGRHVSGGVYTWEHSSVLGEVELARLPGWLAKTRPRAPSSNGDGIEEMPEIPEGHRNATLISLGGSMQRRGMPKAAIGAALATVNEMKCCPPVSDDEIQSVCQSIGRYPPEPTDIPSPGEPARIHNSDLGNARRLVEAHGPNIRFVPPWRRWIVWDGGRWVQDETGQVLRMAKEVVSRLFVAAARMDDPDERGPRIKFALKSENEPRFRGMVKLAETEPGIPIPPSELDRDLWLLNVTNGTLDLRTGELLAAKRERFLTKNSFVAYSPDVPCPRWQLFLKEITDGNDALISYLQRAVGYSITGSTEEHVFFLLYGTGANGKSKFLEAIRSAIGEYARQTPFATFLEKRDEGIRNDLARLAGARFVTASETKRGRQLDEAFVKQSTGGDTVTARFLFQEYFEFEPAFKVWLATNHKPEIQGTDDGIWRRVQLIPFTVGIPKSEQDRKLGEKLQAEAEGILRWAVEGCLEWQRIGLDPPGEVTAATTSYREDSDVLAGFIQDCCVLSAEARAIAGDLYKSYVHWADQQRGEEKMSRQSFAWALEERGILKDRKGGEGRWRYLEIALNAVEEARLKDLKDLEALSG